MEANQSRLARRDYSREGKKGKLMIDFGLLCDTDGCLIVETYSDNTADSGIMGSQISKLRERFGLLKVVLVGNRSLLTEARIR